MRYLLDTNHWSYLQRSHPEVLGHIRSLPNGARLYMPVVAQAELLAGVTLITDPVRRERHRLLYEGVLASCADVLPFDSGVASEYATILARLRRKGTPIETNDIWIAATALAHDLILATSDKHFGYVDGLAVEDWTVPALVSG